MENFDQKIAFFGARSPHSKFVKIRLATVIQNYISLRVGFKNSILNRVVSIIFKLLKSVFDLSYCCQILDDSSNSKKRSSETSKKGRAPLPKLPVTHEDNEEEEQVSSGDEDEDDEEDEDESGEGSSTTTTNEDSKSNAVTRAKLIEKTARLGQAILPTSSSSSNVRSTNGRRSNPNYYNESISNHIT